MWRPKNWDKIVKSECYDGDCVYREIDTFEAGADAILEALMKDGWKPEDEFDQRFLSHRALNDMMTVGEFRKGVWVFIPEEEE